MKHAYIVRIVVLICILYIILIVIKKRTIKEHIGSSFSAISNHGLLRSPNEVDSIILDIPTDGDTDDSGDGRRSKHTSADVFDRGVLSKDNKKVITSKRTKIIEKEGRDSVKGGGGGGGGFVRSGKSSGINVGRILDNPTGCDEGWYPGCDSITTKGVAAKKSSTCDTIDLTYITDPKEKPIIDNIDKDMKVSCPTGYSFTEGNVCKAIDLSYITDPKEKPIIDKVDKDMKLSCPNGYSFTEGNQCDSIDFSYISDDNQKPNIVNKDNNMIVTCPDNGLFVSEKK